MTIRSVLPALLLTAALVATPAAEAAKRKPCSPAGARTVERNAELRVYERKGLVVACELDSNRRVALGPAQSGDGDSWGPADVREVALGRRHVAFLLRGSAPSSQGPFQPDRIGLADVHARRMVDVGATGCADAADGRMLVEAFVLSRRGQLAWLCSGDVRGGGSAYEIRRFDGNGAALVDASRLRSLPDGSPEGTSLSSLTLENARRRFPTIRWLHGTTPRAARLR